MKIQFSENGIQVLIPFPTVNLWETIFFMYSKQKQQQKNVFHTLEKADVKEIFQNVKQCYSSTIVLKNTFL